MSPTKPVLHTLSTTHRKASRGKSSPTGAGDPRPDVPGGRLRLHPIRHSSHAILAAQVGTTPGDDGPGGDPLPGMDGGDVPLTGDSLKESGPGRGLGHRVEDQLRRKRRMQAEGRWNEALGGVQRQQNSRKSIKYSSRYLQLPQGRQAGWLKQLLQQQSQINSLTFLNQ